MRPRASNLANGAFYSAIGMQCPQTILQGREPDPHLRVIGATEFVHIQWGTQRLALKAVKGRLTGHRNDSKCKNVYNPATRRIIMESRNVVFLGTPCLTPMGERQVLIHSSVPSNKKSCDSKSRSDAAIGVKLHGPNPVWFRGSCIENLRKNMGQSTPVC